MLFSAMDAPVQIAEALDPPWNRLDSSTGHARSCSKRYMGPRGTTSGSGLFTQRRAECRQRLVPNEIIDCRELARRWTLPESWVRTHFAATESPTQFRTCDSAGTCGFVGVAQN